MKKITFVMAFTMLTIALFSQDIAPLKYQKSVNLDLLGGGFFLNFSFDMRLRKGVSDGLGFKVGVGGFKALGYGDLFVATLPIEVNYLIGKGNRSLELGIGLLNSYGTNSKESSSFLKDGFNTGTFYPKIGYRYQPSKNGFTYNIAYTPLINSNGFKHYFGFGVGYSFR